MSHTMVLPPITAALLKTEDILGLGRVWHTVNEFQIQVLLKAFSKRRELLQFSANELRNWVSRNAAELNAILKQEGFNIQLEDFGRDGFGVVSILDVLVNWLVTGQVSQVHRDGHVWPAVRLDATGEVEGKYLHLFEAFNSPKHPFPIVKVYTKSGDGVFITVADKAVENFALVDRLNEIRYSLECPRTHYEYLLFPMVDLDQQVDISGLIGIWTTAQDGNDYFIAQAKQQTKFKMNQHGARVKSAVAIGLERMCTSIPRGMIIDQPFFLWIERKDASLPLLYAYIDEVDWKDPGDLSQM